MSIKSTPSREIKGLFEGIQKKKNEKYIMDNYISSEMNNKRKYISCRASRVMFDNWYLCSTASWYWLFCFRSP